MTQSIGIELYKVFNRTRSYIGFIAVLVIVFLLLIVFHSEGETMFGFVAQNLENAFTIQGNPLNGNLYAYLVLKSLWVHFPILIALVTGDLVSGERQTGTLRLILSKPMTRSALITSKFATGMIYVIALVFFMGLISVALGFLVFGNGDLFVLISKLYIFSADDTLWRFVGAYLFGALSMSTVAALAIMLSTMMRSSVAAILSTIAVIIVLNFFATFSVPFFEMVSPFLFTTYMNSWQLFFTYDFTTSMVVQHAGILLLHILIFYLAALFYFNRKDITS